MATIQQNFTNNISVTITLNSLADATTATSSAIVNNVNKYVSAAIQVQVTTTTGTDANGSVTLSILRSVDGGTTYDDVGDNMQTISIFNANVDSTLFVFSMDTSSIGNLPDYWKLVLTNNSGAALETSGNSIKFIGKKYESV